MDSLAGHVFGEAALRLAGHRLVEGQVQEAEVRPLLSVLHQCGRLARTCGRRHVSFMLWCSELQSARPTHTALRKLVNDFQRLQFLKTEDLE